ncbi:hypothetical protein D3C77_131340 [compost metagenome]
MAAQARIIVQPQLDLLAHGQGRPQGDDVANRLLQVERRRLDGHLAGLDPGDVEDVRQQTFQGHAGRADHVHQFAVAFGQLAPRQGVGHGHHPVEGGADLMAHIGQKLALGPVRRLGVKLGLFQAARLPPLPQQDEQHAEDEDQADAQNPVLAADHGALQLGVGPRRLQLAASLGQLLLHVAGHLVNAGAEPASRMQIAAAFIVAQDGERLPQTARGEQEFRLDQMLPGVDDAARGQFAQPRQIAAGAGQVAQPGPRHAPERQNVERQKGLAVDQGLIGREAVQHPGRIPAPIGHEGAQGGVIGAQALQIRPLRQAMVGGVIMLGLRQVPHLKRHAGQIVETVEVGTRIVGVGIVDLEPTEGIGGAGHVAQFHQPHAGHFPHAGAGRGGEGIVDGNFRLHRAQQAQPLADAVLIHQSQGAQPGGVRLDEPVARGPGRAIQLGHHGHVALVIADGQGVQPGDAQVALVILGARLCGKTVVPQGRLVEIPLVQHRPGDMIEAIEPLAVATFQRLQTEGLQGREIGAGGPRLDRLGQFHRLRRRRWGRCRR